MENNYLIQTIQELSDSLASEKVAKNQLLFELKKAQERIQELEAEQTKGDEQ